MRKILSKQNLIRFDCKSSQRTMWFYSNFIKLMEKRNSRIWREEIFLAEKNSYREVITPPTLPFSLCQGRWWISLSFGLKTPRSPFSLMQMKAKGDRGDGEGWDLFKKLKRLLGISPLISSMLNVSSERSEWSCW